MTDAMLSLAIVVYPASAVTNDKFGLRVWNGRGGTAVLFDPVNNADQFCDVLAWLLRQRPVYRYRGIEGRSWFELSYADVSEVIYRPSWPETEECGCWPHDGTASGIRDAVVGAAIRVVVGGEK